MIPDKKGPKTKVEEVNDPLVRSFVVDYFEKSCGNPGLKVSKVEKISNRSVQRRFLSELQIIREKNPNLRLDQLLRVLWHGTRANSPLSIAQSEAGLDMRYAS